MKIISVDVIGTPASQGSLVGNGRYGMRYQNDKVLKMWRCDVITELIAKKPDDWDVDAAFSVSCELRFMRPKAHYGKKGLRPSAPKYKTTKIDLDKGMRAIGDAIEQSGLIRNDSQIIHWTASKRYCDTGESPGASITLSSQP